MSTQISAFEKFRNRVSGVVLALPIPFRKTLGYWVMAKATKDKLEEFSNDFAESVRKFNTQVQDLAAKSQTCAYWLTDDHFAKLFPEYNLGGCGRIVAMDAMATLGCFVANIDCFVILFERYVQTETEFRALLESAFTGIALLRNHGYVESETGLFLDLERNGEAVFTLFTAHLAAALMRAARDTWNHDTILADIRSLCDVPGRWNEGET